MVSLAYFLIFGIRTVMISAWYLPWLQWSFPDDDEKEPRFDHVIIELIVNTTVRTARPLRLVDMKVV